MLSKMLKVKDINIYKELLVTIVVVIIGVVEIQYIA
jgi:hypothetical protein